MSDTSRDPADLHPELQRAWEYLRHRWEEENPDGPIVGLSATYRGPIDQQAAFDRGASRVTFGQSLHNFEPAYAFDIYFNRDGVADWTFSLFERFAAMAEEIGLEWGGRWRTLVDGAHFQLKGATIADAKAGIIRNHVQIPEKPPATYNPWVLVVMQEGSVLNAVEIPAGHAIFTRVSSERRRFYVDVRADSV